MKEKVLLHACCAVCAAHPIELMKTAGYEVIVYFFNPNIYPEPEYERRLNELIRYSKKKEIELIVDTLDHTSWQNYISGLENEPERGKRCTKCFEYRLKAAAIHAVKLGIDKFTTSLTVSPHKNSKVIMEKGREAALEHGINFLEYDFKKQNGFLKTMEIAKKEGFYRQQYCGCEYSISLK